MIDNKNISISYEEIFAVVESVTAAISDIAGIDLWRNKTNKKRFQTIDPELAKERVSPPSKRKQAEFGNVGGADTIWAHMHFGLMMPALISMKSFTKIPEIKVMKVDKYRARDTIRDFDDVCNHMETYYKFTEVMEVIMDNLPDNKKHLVTMLEVIGANYNKEGFKGGLVAALAYHIKGHENIIYKELKKLSKKDKPDFSIFMALLLDILPHKNGLHPFFRKKLDHQTYTSNNQNDMIGRILQTYYAHKHNKYKDFGIDTRAKKYFAGTDRKTVALHQRTLVYFLKEVPNCPIPLNKQGIVPDIIFMSDIFSYYCNWFRKQEVVEMVTPSFDGAAVDATSRIVRILDDIYKETSGKLDLRNYTLTSAQAKLFRKNTGLLRRIGRMAMVMDAVGNGNPYDVPMNGISIRRLAKKIWPANVRKTIWRNQIRYIIDPERGFVQFRQDIATIIHSIALNLEDHAEYRPGKQYVSRLKKLAKDILKARSENKIKLLIVKNKNLIVNTRKIIIEIEKLCIKSSRCSYGISFIANYYGIAEITPVAITTKDILKGLPVITFDKKTQLLKVKYVEKDHPISFSIKLAGERNEEIKSVKYIDKPIKVENIKYSSYYEILSGKELIKLPQLGRKNYAPGGRAGAMHSGLVIGYGCSVFHGTLQFLQILAAYLGATTEDLKAIEEKMWVINKKLDQEFHQRTNLAGFITEQTNQAFNQNKQLTYAKWIRKQTKRKFSAKGFAHTKKYTEEVRKGKNSEFIEYSKEIANFTWYAKNYPSDREIEKNMDPRYSYYDDSDARLYKEYKRDINLPPYIRKAFAFK